MNWPKVELAAVADVIRGVTFSKGDTIGTPETGFLPVLRAGNISDQLNVHDDLVFVKDDLVSEHQRLQRGDIVVCMSSGSSNVLGKSAMLQGEWRGSFGAFLAAVRPQPEKMCAQFLSHYLRTPEFRLWTSSSSGIGIKNIRASDLKAFQIPLPPLPEQKRIAAILDQADALRRLRARALEKLNTLGQAIFQEMFGEILDSHDTVHLGDATSKIGSGATPRGGDAAYKSEGIPLIRSMNVRDGTFSTKGLAFIDADQAGKLNNVAVKAKDVLLNITGASVARVCIAPEDMNGARVNQHVAIIRCTSNLLPEFLEAFLLLPRIKAKLLNIAEGGATRQAITKAQIQDLEVPRTRVSEQKAFVKRRRAVTAQQGYMLHQASTAESLFASLQHRAFRGEL